MKAVFMYTGKAERGEVGLGQAQGTVGKGRQGEKVSRVREVGRQTDIPISQHQDYIWLEKKVTQFAGDYLGLGGNHIRANILGSCWVPYGYQNFRHHVIV